ncbi:MAG: helix-turn-helix domain-containing protein [Chloroflexota bacterium]|nr:helix-turn-helix domain-containing protein [Chloroflexota bacterium]
MTTKEAADILGIGRQGVRDLIHRSQLPAEKVGRDWIIRFEDLKDFQKRRRSPGRPPMKEGE